MTIIIIAITSLVSIIAFQNKELFDKLKFNPYMVYHKKEWHRLFSHALLHADWSHLIFNMLTLYFFGQYTERYFIGFFGSGIVVYVVFYIASIAVASLTTLYKYKNHHYYNSIGASGAVSAVLFASILFDPMSGISLIMIPIPIPGFIYGIAYLAYSHYMSKQNKDNIDHDAHLIGALFGFIFPIILNPRLINLFISQF